MADTVHRITTLPARPIDAAADFYAAVMPGIREDFRDLPNLNLTIVFKAAGPEHRAWRLAAIQELARESAPGRVNGVAGDDEKAIGQAIAWLEGAPGVTGQLLEVC